jgi:hypothetical protein
MSYFLKKLSLLLRKNFFALLWHYRHLEVMQESYVLDLLSQDRYREPLRLNRCENQCFSQHGQDGIIAEIFRRIGTVDKTFVEIGAGDGLENNTTYLRRIERTFSSLIRSRRLKVQPAFITRENVAELLKDLQVPSTFDFLSVDIDRNTYYLLESLASYRPRVAVVEYNSSYLPGDEWVVDYQAEKVWNSTNYIGASLKSLELLMDRLGYHLVGCETIGVDAFFVRKDLTKDLFCEPFTAENHYEPPRFFLIRKQGHPSCFSDET